MTLLHEYSIQDFSLIGESREFVKIAFDLLELGVVLSRWSALEQLLEGASDEEILEMHKWDSERLIRKRGYQVVDIVSVRPDSPGNDELRDKFLREHSHNDDEARFFAAGGGLFYFRAANRIVGVQCGPGDLIYFPPGIKHWFDMGLHPRFTCIRFFTREDGWVPEYTGSDIADNFPAYPGPLSSEKSHD